MRSLPSGLWVAALLLVAGCSGGGEAATKPADVVRAWSTALNADRNDAAADLFATGAVVVQGGGELRLASHGDAVAWNEALPCDGRIVDLKVDGEVVTATFRLADSRTTPCDAPGQEATAVFTVREGKIVRWEQAGGSPPSGPVV